MTSLLLNSMDTFLSSSYPTALQDLTWLTTLLLLKVSPPLVSMTTPSPSFPSLWALLFIISHGVCFFFKSTTSFPFSFLLLPTFQIIDH
jgi:hypothetical protein